MKRLDNDHHSTQMPLVSAVHTITVTYPRVQPCAAPASARVTPRLNKVSGYFACGGGRKLDTTEDQDEAAEPAAKVKSVAATVLGEFFDTLEKEEGFGEIAPGLRKVVLEDGVFAEPAIRAALFPEAS